MLTIFNRRELHMTYDMNDRVRVCDILQANNIPGPEEIFLFCADRAGNMIILKKEEA